MKPGHHTHRGGARNKKMQGAGRIRVFRAEDPDTSLCIPPGSTVKFSRDVVFATPTGISIVSGDTTESKLAAEAQRWRRKKHHTKE